MRRPKKMLLMEYKPEIKTDSDRVIRNVARSLVLRKARK